MSTSSPTAERVDPAQLIATGRRVIGIEAAALAELGAGLGPGFAEAAARMLAARGRVIVSGMGKSGHVARKIAATLASTGTPALFVHPAEASHGDLGMITGDDVVLLLSNSGETPELADLIAYTRRFAIPLIGVAGKAGLDAPPPVRRGDRAAGRAGGLLGRAGADHLDDDDAGARRRARGGADGAPGVQPRGLPRPAPGRPARGAARQGRRPDAWRRGDAADRAGGADGRGADRDDGQGLRRRRGGRRRGAPRRDRDRRRPAPAHGGAARAAGRRGDDARGRGRSRRRRWPPRRSA